MSTENEVLHPDEQLTPQPRPVKGHWLEIALWVIIGAGVLVAFAMRHWGPTAHR